MPYSPLAPDCFYHVYTRGNNRENLFAEQRNYPYFLKLYARHILPVADTYAYCLMPNHLHLLIRTFTEDEQMLYQQKQNQEADQPFQWKEPSQAFNNLFIAYARAFNKAQGRTGALFESPFRRKRVQTESYFMALVVYIHRNAQHHGFVSDFREWGWSSYRTFSAVGESHVQRDDVLGWFSGAEFFDEAHGVEANGRLIKPLVDEDFD